MTEQVWVCCYRMCALMLVCNMCHINILELLSKLDHYSLNI